MAWIGKFFSDNRHKSAVIHVAHMIVVNSRFRRPFMKRYFDGDRSLGPARTLKRFPSYLFCASSQLRVDEVPARTVDVFGSKFGGANDLDQLFETSFGFLYSTVPVPVAKEKRKPVWIRIERSRVFAPSRPSSETRILFSKGYQTEVL